MLVVTKSLCGFVSNQVQYNMESAQYLGKPGDLGSIPGRVILKTQKMVLDTFLLNTQQYKVRIKGKVEQSREKE